RCRLRRSSLRCGSDRGFGRPGWPPAATLSLTQYGIGAGVWGDHAGARCVQAGFGEVSPHDASCHAGTAEGATGGVIKDVRIVVEDANRPGLVRSLTCR